MIRMPVRNKRAASESLSPNPASVRRQRRERAVTGRAQTILRAQTADRAARFRALKQLRATAQYQELTPA